MSTSRNEEEIIPPEETVQLQDEGPVDVDGRVLCRRLRMESGEAVFRFPRQKRRGEKKPQFPYCSFAQLYRAYDGAPAGGKVCVNGYVLFLRKDGEGGVPMLEFKSKGGEAVCATMDRVLEALFRAPQEAYPAVKIPREELVQARLLFEAGPAIAS